MKRIAIILLTLCLISAAALAETDINALNEANNVVNVHEIYPTTVQHVEYFYPETGETRVKADIYGIYDPVYGLALKYIYDDGGVYVLENGMAYGCHGENNELYVFGFVGNAYQEHIDEISKQNLGEFAEGMEITSESIREDGKLLITVQGPVPRNPNFGEDLWELNITLNYVIDPDTLVDVGCETYIDYPDGTQKLYAITSLETGVTWVSPFDITPITNPEKTREVRVISDPGTDSEQEWLFTAPFDVRMYIYTPSGYSLYEDAACTIEYEGPERGENGEYPETETIYYKK